MLFTSPSIGSSCSPVNRNPSGGWVRVTRRDPCPVCNGPDNCSVSADGGAVWCGRESVYLGSPAVRQNAGGPWLHILRDRPEWTPPPTPRRRKSSKGKSKRFLAERAAIAKRAAGRRLHELCEHLGVDVLSELRALGVGWFDVAELVELEPWQNRWKELPCLGVWTVPFRNAAGNVLGIQTRDDSRDKAAISGGELGLIFRDDFSDRPGPVWMPE